MQTTSLVSVYNSTPVVSSKIIAEDFGKEHKDVLESVRNILAAENSAAKFYYETTYENRGKQYPMYLMNRDGFSLLVMGFTGKQALDWKIKYINAFNEMEKELATPKLTPVPRYRARQLSTALNDMEKTKEALQKMFKVGDGMAYAKAISLVESTYGVQLDIIKDMLPAAEKQTGFLTPTEIGQLIGKSAREVNLLLVGYGFQHKEGKVWRLDEAGREYGEEIPYTNNGHSGYQIKWNESVVDFIQSRLEDDSKKKRMLTGIYNQFVYREQSAKDYRQVRDFAIREYIYSKPLTERGEIANAYARIENDIASPNDIWLIIEYFTDAKGEYIANVAETIN